MVKLCFISKLKRHGEFGINKFKNENNSVLIITHYQRLLDYIKPDVVHLMIDGKIVKTGDMSLVEKVEKDGYSWLEK